MRVQIDERNDISGLFENRTKMHLSTKTILITGGSSGIGLELAVQLHQKGNVVLITGRSAEKLAAAEKREPGIITIQSDVTRLEEMKSLHDHMVKEYPSLNVLINNAGIMRKINLHNASANLETMIEEVSINLVSAVQMTTLFLPLLKKQKEAAIVNITSGLAFVPFPISPLYGASKAALHSFTECLRVQLEKTAIKVIEVAPPKTTTDLTVSFGDDFDGGPEMSAHDVATAACKGIESETDLVLPGLSRVLRWMGRIAPGFMLKQLSKGNVEKLLEENTTGQS